MKAIATAKDPSMRVRFPEHLMGQLREEARRNGRSFNSEVVKRLQESLQRPAA